MKLNLLFLSLFVNSVVYNHVFAAEQVLFAGASHIGGRPNNEDAWNEDYFSVNDKKYYLSMVCDGHAGETIAKFVRKEFSSILQKCLKSETDIGQAFYNAFEQCDNTILKTQNIQGNNEPGTTAVMMLSDASKREQYIANLGDSRFCIISADDGRLKWSTEDHTLTTEKDYIESHGGEIRRGTTGDPGIFLKNGSKESMGRAVPRAFGNAHLKRHGADGKIGPMNNVPTIYVRKLESNEIYLLFTDGYPVLVGDWDINIQSHWCDILNLGSEKFKEAYKWECKEDPSLLGCKCIKSNFDVHKQMEGNDGFLRNIVWRLFYIAQYIAASIDEDTVHEKPDNTTILAVRVKNIDQQYAGDQNKPVVIEKKHSENKMFSVKNILFNRYSCLLVAVIGCFLYLKYAK